MGSSFTQGKNNFSCIIMSILHLHKFFLLLCCACVYACVSACIGWCIFGWVNKGGYAAISLNWAFVLPVIGQASLLEFIFLLQVRPVAEDEMFKVLRTGKRKSKFS